MPFSPLPATFQADLRCLGARGVLELGSGDGAFTDLLRRQGVTPWTLDRRSPCAGARQMVRGDALAPPFRRPFGVVVAANLLRQTWQKVKDEGPVAWRDLVAPGGCLWILEDEPLSRPAPVRNYRLLQEFLAELLPASRAPLLPSKVFSRLRRSWGWPGAWDEGSLANHWPLSGPAVLDMLSSGEPDPGTPAARMIAAIAQDGISCGRCWWARWQPEDR